MEASTNKSTSEEVVALRGLVNQLQNFQFDSKMPDLQGQPLLRNRDGTIMHAYLVFRTDIKPDNIWSDYLSLRYLKKPPKESPSNPKVNIALFGTSLHSCIKHLDFESQSCAVFKIPLTVFGEDIGLLFCEDTGVYIDWLISKDLNFFLTEQTKDVHSIEINKKIMFIEFCLNMYDRRDITECDFSVGRYLFENRLWMNPLISTGNQQCHHPQNCRIMLIPYTNQKRLMKSKLPCIHLKKHDLDLYKMIVDTEVKVNKSSH
jgi:hypothetical protein